MNVKLAETDADIERCFPIKKLCLVEFTSEFVEQDWCFKGHIGCILEGELDITFAGKTERFSAGDGIFIVGEEEERHKAKATGSVVRLLLVEDAFNS
ncbi:MAG TPA: hypothetical protein VGO27_00315 [Candidatus Acidoferrum sp.]|nr:hypothetical protein [Candidatus Acidoferrum sp.]